MAFDDSAKHQKALVKQCFGASRKVDQIALYNLWDTNDLEPKSKNGLQNHQFPSGILEFLHMGNNHVVKPYKPCRK